MHATDLVRRRSRRDEDHALEPELLPGPLRDREMPEVRRIEGAAENPEARRAPLPGAGRRLHSRRRARSFAARAAIGWPENRRSISRSRSTAWSFFPEIASASAMPRVASPACGV